MTPWPRGEARACKARTRQFESARCLCLLGADRESAGADSRSRTSLKAPGRDVASAASLSSWAGLSGSRVSRCAVSLPRSFPGSPSPSARSRGTRSGAFGRATARWRPLPDFLVIGAQKAGTTALYAYLRWHPAITGPSWKEVSFFDRHWWRGEAWYRGQFSLRPRAGWSARRAPATSSTRSPPSGPRAVVPDAKLVAVAPRPRRPRVLPVPARGRARPRAALVRGRAGGRGRSDARRGRAPARRSARLQPRLVGPHLRRARALRGAARAVARGLPA